MDHEQVADPAQRPGHRQFAFSRWVVTVIVTVASLCVLDGVATTTGLLLAASRVLDGVRTELVVVVLALSYVLWAAGLRINLRANWRLLNETGTSTNALSKAAFDLARHRSSGPGAQRASVSACYVLTELAKEGPYVVGAVGAAVLTDAIDAMDALVFLAGTNFGAAAYEYTVARLTRVYLDRRPVTPGSPAHGDAARAAGS